MSAVENTIAPVEAPATTEPAFTTPAETPAALPTEETTAAPEIAATEPIAEPEAVPAAEPATETAATETAATEEPAVAEETAVVEPAKAVDSGVLGYKAPGLIKSLKFSKKHFWFGEEPVATKDLSSYLRGEKPEVAHPTAAWSSQTGKGLLFFAKQADETASPAGVLNLSEASDLEKQSPHEFSFKLHGGKHTFKATDDAERDGWFVALEKAIPEAKVTKESIVGSDGYKESLAAVAGGAVVGASAARKSTDAPKTDAPARTTSDDEEDVTAKKNKSRSQSRNKRTSIFGKLLEKKDEHEIKKDIKKEDKAEAKEEKKEEKEEAKEEKAEGETLAETTPLDAEAVASRVHDAPVEGAEPVAATEETPVAVTEKPRPAKRNSLFGSFFEKVRSPTTEKKESEVGPVVPPKDTIVSAEAPQIPEPTTETTIESPATAEPVLDAPAVAAPETEAKTETPAASSTVAPRKEKESFFGGMINKVRAKSPANLHRSAKTEDAPAVPPKTEESVVAPTEEPVAAEATTAEEPAAVEPTTAVSTEEPITDATNRPKESRRKSFFGGLSTKAEGLFRKPSQVNHSKEAKKEESTAPALEPTEETAAVEPTATEEAATEAPATETVAAEPEQPQSIGDVSGDAITVGQANHTVSAAA